LFHHGDILAYAQQVLAKTIDHLIVSVPWAVGKSPFTVPPINELTVNILGAWYEAS
jgi:hypothetical protein